MKIAPIALDRIRQSGLAPKHFIEGFGALLAAVNHTGNTGLAITIDYAEPGESIGPDELFPIITLSFRQRRRTN